MYCPIAKQISDHVNQDDSICPECECFAEEKHNTYGSWIECTNQQCGWSTDIDDGDE